MLFNHYLFAVKRQAVSWNEKIQPTDRASNLDHPL